MKIRSVFYALGRLTQLMGLVLLIPLGISMWDYQGDEMVTHPEGMGFLITVGISLVVGTVVQRWCRSGRFDLGIREGFAVVALGWVFLALLGSIPLTAWFYSVREGGGADGLFLAFTDAYFETMSGFSTTGSTILDDVEALPRGLLFWRSLTHWLGGMGIITLALAIFPAMGVGGYQMFRGEMPGPSADRLRPRLAETAMVLWGVYVVLTAVEALLLNFGGMPIFDSLCHAFGTLATGGFSTRNGSIGAYESAYFEWVIIAFMFLAGVNFLFHYRAFFQGDWRSIRESGELHFYVGTVVVATIVVAVVMGLFGTAAPELSAHHFQNEPASVLEHHAHVAHEDARFDTAAGTVRTALFQVLAIVTTTGYGTADFDVWPRALGLLFVLLMFWGACAGSTSGGMKLVRIMVVAKAGWRELKKVVRPHLIAPVKIERHAVKEPMVSNILGFFVLFIILFAGFSLIMTFFIPDLTTAVTSVIATMGNIGPGLSGVGPTQSFSWVPVPGKWVLILAMLLGRLEIFTVLVMFRPSFWRK